MKNLNAIISILLYLFVLNNTALAEASKVLSSNKIIRLATTTSTENSGLLAYLLPVFEKQTGYKIQVIAVGTGKALRMGKDGDVDVLLVHALEAEEDFVKKGYGLKRYPVMANDFVVLGDARDPAAISNSNTVQSAFQKIQSTQSLFISRGDDSGTHKKEMIIWHLVKPSWLDKALKGSWYREIGQGMGKAIQIANELGAYTLSDRGTWLSYQDKVDLQILYEGDTSLTNPYGIIAVSPERYADINVIGANSLIQWLISKPGQQLIGQYKKHNQVLFLPLDQLSAATLAIQQPNQ